MAKIVVESTDGDCCGVSDHVLFVPDDIVERLAKKGILFRLIEAVAYSLWNICANCLDTRIVEDNVGFDARVDMATDDSYGYYKYKEYIYWKEEGV